MNQDELIEKCRLTAKEIYALLISNTQIFRKGDSGRVDCLIIVEAQLRKAIPIIEAEARKAERERVVKELEEHIGSDRWGNPTITIGYNHGGNRWYYEWWQALKGEGDE